MITPDEAIEACVKEGAHGISLGLARNLQAERNRLIAENAALAALVVEKDKAIESQLAAMIEHHCGPDPRQEKERNWYVIRVEGRKALSLTRPAVNQARLGQAVIEAAREWKKAIEASREHWNPVRVQDAGNRVFSTLEAYDAENKGEA